MWNGRSRSLHLSIRVIKQTVVIIRGRGMSIRSTTYKIVSNTLLSSLNPYAEETIENHQCGFQHNRSTADHILFISQILEKKWEYSEAVHQLFIYLFFIYLIYCSENLASTYRVTNCSKNQFTTVTFSLCV